MTDPVHVRRVVIADDDEDMRMLIQIAVRKAGFDLVAAAADGGAAWEAIQGHKPELIVLDVSMPVMSGLDVCRLVRSDPAIAHTPVLLLSAGVSGASMDAGIEAGADDFIAKPFSPKVLTERLVALAAERGRAQ